MSDPGETPEVVEEMSARAARLLHEDYTADDVAWVSAANERLLDALDAAEQEIERSDSRIQIMQDTIRVLYAQKAELEADRDRWREVGDELAEKVRYFVDGDGGLADLVSALALYDEQRGEAKPCEACNDTGVVRVHGAEDYGSHFESEYCEKCEYGRSLIADEQRGEG